MKTILLVCSFFISVLASAQSVLEKENQQLKKRADSLQSVLNEYHKQFWIDTVYYIDFGQAIKTANNQEQLHRTIDENIATLPGSAEITIYEFHYRNKKVIELNIYLHEETDSWKGQKLEFDQDGNTLRYAHFYGWHNGPVGQEGKLNFETEWQYLNGALLNYGQSIIYEGKSFVDAERVNFIEENAIDPMALNSVDAVFKYFNLKK